MAFKAFSDLSQTTSPKTFITYPFHAPGILIYIDFAFWKPVINFINNFPEQRSGFLLNSLLSSSFWEHELRSV
jgi:hypothetical protein